MTDIRNFPHFKAVIFDLDGTLIDTERLVIDSGVAALEALGFPPRRDLLDAMVGLVNTAGYPHIAKALGPTFDPARFDAAWDSAAQALFAGPIPCRPGAADLLAMLRDHGIPCAVATNSTTASARANLEAAGLIGFFAKDRVIGRDQVEHPKPAPDVFLAAARALDMPPRSCLVFEDSDVGTTGAVAADMTVVLVPDQIQPRTDAATLIAPSLLAGARTIGLFPAAAFTGVLP